MPVSKLRRARTLLVLAAAALAMLAASAAEAAGKPDFDIRGPRATTPAAPPAPLPPGQQRALDELRAGGTVEVRWSALTGAPSRIHLRGKPLTLPSAAPPRAIEPASRRRIARRPRGSGTRSNDRHPIVYGFTAEGPLP